MTTPAQTIPGPQAQTEPGALRAQRRTLLLFLGAFLLPVIAAYTLLATGWWTDAGSVNRGQLLTPPISLDATFHDLLYNTRDESSVAARNGKKPWVVLTAITDSCNTSCQNALMLVRQTQTLLGPERHRVQVALIHTQNIQTDTQSLISENFPNLNVVNLNTERLDPNTHTETQVSLSSLEQRTQVFAAPNSDTSQLLIIDPLGNGMLLHTVPSDQTTAILEGKGFVKDLKRLLKYSRIG